MINNISKGPDKKIESITGIVYEPSNDWLYSHHASITYFNHRFWAIWSNGKINEDDCGQRVLMAQSCDGEHWEGVRPIVTPDMLGDPKKVLISAGFYVNGETLNVYFGSYNYSEEALHGGQTRPYHDGSHENTALGVVSTTDGINWSKPQGLGLNMVPNHGPQKTSSGRLIISGNIMFPYTDNPDGIHHYKSTGIYGAAFGQEIPRDDSEAIHYVHKFRGWDTNLICEGSFYQTDDNVIHMMLRSNTRYLWHTESRDDGETWSEPERTEYSDDSSKFHFGRLPDGRYYGVSNTNPGGGRNPLDICISEDGINFNKHFILQDEPYEMKAEGMYKGGHYGYPHTLIHDNYMYVIYSKGKETIEVTKFSLDQL